MFWRDHQIKNMIDINNDFSMGLKFSMQVFIPIAFSYKKVPISINNPKHDQPVLPPEKTKPIT